MLSAPGAPRTSRSRTSKGLSAGLRLFKVRSVSVRLSVLAFGMLAPVATPWQQNEGN